MKGVCQISENSVVLSLVLALINYSCYIYLKTTELSANLTHASLSLLFIHLHPELRSFNRQSDQSVNELSQAFEIGDLGLHLGH